MTELRIAARQLAELHQRMLAVAPAEAAAFLWTERSGSSLVVHDVRVFDQLEMDRRADALQLDDDVQAAALAEVKREGHTLVEVHTHPGSGSSVRFSSFDLQELPSFARYVRLKMPGRGFGALVLGESGYQGLLWSDEEPRPLTLRAVGEYLAQPSWLPGHEGSKAIEARYDRQLRALGPAGQRRLSYLRVGVVGLGGTGSQVVQQLAHLGVRDFCLVDDDRVDRTNLPRLAGAAWWDTYLRTRKSRVARRLIRRLGGRPRVDRYGELRSAGVLSALRQVDLIIGCVDNDGARLVVSELAAAHLVPYLDVGVGVETGSQPPQIGGRVSFYLPGGPCLACADEIDFGEAAEDLEPEPLRRIRLARGYARDREIEPALMPLNTVCVGLAMIETLAYVTGVRPVQPFARYDALRDRVTHINVDLNPECPVCRPAYGMGDRHAVDRYAK